MPELIPTSCIILVEHVFITLLDGDSHMNKKDLMAFDVSVTNIMEYPVLVLRCETESLYAVSVLETAKTDLSTADADRNTLYHNLIRNSEYLRQVVVNLDWKLRVVNDESTSTQLLTCNPQHKECMKVHVILRAGVDTSTVDDFGDTCLHKILHREYLSLEYDHETL